MTGSRYFLNTLELDLSFGRDYRATHLGVKVVGIKSGHRGFYTRTASAGALEDMGETIAEDADPP